MSESRVGALLVIFFSFGIMFLGYLMGSEERGAKIWSANVVELQGKLNKCEGELDAVSKRKVTKSRIQEHQD